MPGRTVSDLQLADNILGLVVAGMSVVSSSMQQIFCRTMQQKHKLSSHELLSNTAPVQVRRLVSPRRAPRRACRGGSCRGTPNPATPCWLCPKHVVAPSAKVQNDGNAAVLCFTDYYRHFNEA